MTDSNAVLAVDQGTQSSRAVVFDSHGELLASAQQSVSLARRGRYRAEQNGAQILRATCTVIDTALDHVDVRRRDVTAAGIATQRSSVLGWDRHSGVALSPVLSWQDRRTHRWLNTLRPVAGEIQRRSGLPLTPHYGASKLRWLMNEVAAVQQAQREGRLTIGPLASFLVCALLRGRPRLVDHANGGRTQLLNVQTQQWDNWLLERFGVSAEWLPEPVPTCHQFGKLQESDIPVTAVNGDQTAALYAFGPLPRDTAVVNLGTGGFTLVATGARRIADDQLLCGIAASDRRRVEYVLEGTVNGAGAALRWAARRLGVRGVRHHLSQWLSTAPAPELLFLNSVGGLGSPWWSQGPAPGWLTLHGEPVRRPAPVVGMAAVAESVVFLVQSNLAALRRAGLVCRTLRVTGGLARVAPICQRLADLSDCLVERPADSEATAKGMAWLAAGRPLDWVQSPPRHRYAPRSNPALRTRFELFEEQVRARL